MNKSNIILEEKYVLEYIRDILNDYKLKFEEVKDADYHHNVIYSKAFSIAKYGILSLNMLNELGLTKYTKEQLAKLDDIESHINGVDGISLSVIGLTDLYSDEDEYNPFCENYVDILVSNEVKAKRATQHYGNEFIAYKKIPQDKLKAFDIRLFKLMGSFNTSRVHHENIKAIEILTENYNYLIKLANALKENKLNIPLREMSETQICLDIDSLSKTRQITLKK